MKIVGNSACSTEDLTQLKSYVYDIIGCCQEVHRDLGPWLNEYVYQEALKVAFEEKQIPFEKEYFDTHRTGTLIVTGGKSYSIRFFASLKAEANESMVFDPTEIKTSELLDFLAKNAAIYYPGVADKDAKIIALSTCMSGLNLKRMVIFGVLTETNE